MKRNGRKVTHFPISLAQAPFTVFMFPCLNHYFGQVMINAEATYTPYYFSGKTCAVRNLELNKP